MKRQRVLLVASQHAASRQITTKISSLAAEIFLHARFHVLEINHEVGWPGSCNHIFSSALQFVEKNFNEDMFWLEPDAIPLCPEWYEVIQDEWESREPDNEFMGAYVKLSVPHMSGVGVYGKNWRRYAPSLIESPDNTAWDIHASKHLVHNTHFTHLIQHTSKNPDIASLDILNDDAVVFHQNKSGSLIELIDQDLWAGEASRHPLYGGSAAKNQPINMPTKYYHAENANRRIRQDGYEFLFDAYAQFAGTWRGVYQTSDEGEIIALDRVAANPRNGVTEITAAQYEASAKKKAKPSSALSPTLKQGQQVQVKEKPAVLVEGRPPSPGDDKVEAKSLEELIKIEVVKPAQSQRQETGKKKKGKGS